VPERKYHRTWAMFCLRRVQLSATTATDCNPCRLKDESLIAPFSLNLDRDLRRQSETLCGATGSDVVHIETAKI
jgi:hypothetical protein